MGDFLEHYLRDTTGEESGLVEENDRFQEATVDLHDDHSSLTEKSPDFVHMGSTTGHGCPETPSMDTVSEFSTPVENLEASSLSMANSTLPTPISTSEIGMSPLASSFRGPLSPFSPILHDMPSTIADSTISWQFLETMDLSLVPCRSVSVVVRVHVPRKMQQQQRLCLFPLVPEPITQSGLVSPISATMKAASSTETKSMVLVNPSAFGKFIPGEVTVETARLVANVANIGTEDWARRYKFDEVVWPEVDSANRRAQQSAFVKLAHSIANDGAIRQQSSLCMCMGSQGSGRTGTIFGSAAFKRRGDVTPERYGLLGMTFAALLRHLPEDAVCTLSILEIVDEERLRDLLASDPNASQSKLKIRHPDNKGAIVQNLADVPLDSITCLEHLARKAFHSTATLRARSSEGIPGYIIATIKVWQNGAQFDLANGAKCTSLQFVDLANGEDGPNRLDAENTRRMAWFRNSASALRGVLRGKLLREAGEISSRAISYRECTLTKLLQRQLELQGNRSILVAAVSASSDSHERTLHTLDYVNRLFTRPGKTAQSPFGSAPQPAHDTSNSSNTFLEHINSSAGSDELLKNVISDPRQRLAKLLKKPSHTSSATKSGLSPSVTPRKLDLGGTVGDGNVEDYEPYDYMQIDPGFISSAYSPSHLKRSNRPTFASSEVDADVDGQQYLEAARWASDEDRQLLELPHAPSSVDYVGSENGWSDDELEKVVDRELHPFDREDSGVNASGTYPTKCIESDDGDPFCVSDRIQPSDIGHLPATGDGMSLPNTDHYIENEVELREDERDPFNLNTRFIGNGAPVDDEEGQLGNEYLVHPPRPSAHLLQDRLEATVSSSDVSGLRSDIGDLRVEDDAAGVSSVPKSVLGESGIASHSMLHTYINTSCEKAGDSQDASPDLVEEDTGLTYRTYPLSVSSASRKSEICQESEMPSSDLHVSVSPPDHGQIENGSPSHAYLEEIDKLEGNVDQIRRLHKGVWRSSSLSIERLRSHERAQQQFVEQAERERMKAVAEVNALNEMTTRQRHDHEDAMLSSRKKLADLECRLETALRNEEAMGKIAEEAIAAQDKLEQSLSNTMAENAKMNHASESTAVKYTSLVESRDSVMHELETTKSDLRFLTAEHSSCQEAIAVLKKEIERLDIERSKLQRRCENEEAQMKGFAELKAEHSSLLDRLKSSEDEKQESSKSISKERSEMKQYKAQHDTRVASLERENSALEAELASLRRRAVEEADSADNLVREMKTENSQLRIDLAEARTTGKEELAASRRAAENASTELARISLTLQSRDEDLDHLRQEKSALLADCTNERRRLQEVEDAMRTLKRDAREKVERLLGERTQLQRRLSEHELRIRENDASGRTLSESLESLREERQLLESTATDLRTQLDSERRTREQAESSYSEVQALLVVSNTEVDALRDKVESLRSLEESLASLRSEMHEEKLMRSQVQALNSGLKSQLEEKEGRLESMNDQLGALRSLEPKLESFRQRATEETNGRAEAEGHLSATQAKLTESRTALASIKEELNALKVSHESAARVLRRQVETEQRLRSQAEAASQSLLAQLDEIVPREESLRQELDVLKISRQKNDIEVREMLRTEQMARFDAESTSQFLQSQVEDKTLKYEALREEIDSLKRSQQMNEDEVQDMLHIERLARAEAETATEALRAQLEGKEWQIHAVRRELEAVQASSREKEDDIRALTLKEESARVQAEGEAEIFRMQLEKDSEQRAQLQHELDVLRASLQKSERELQELIRHAQQTKSLTDGRSEALQSKLEESERQRESISRELEALKVEKENTQDRSQDRLRKEELARIQTESILDGQLEESEWHRESTCLKLEALQSSQEAHDQDSQDSRAKERLAHDQSKSIAESLRAELQESEQQRTSLRQALEEVEALRQEKEGEVQELIRKEHMTKAQTSAVIEGLQSQLSESDRTRDSTNLELEALHASPQTEVTDVIHKQRLAPTESGSSADSCRSQVEDSERQHGLLVGKVERPQVALKPVLAVQHARADSDSVAKVLRAKLEESEQQQDMLKRRLDTLQASQHIQEDTSDLFRSEQEARSRAEHNIAALQEELLASRKQVQSLQSELTSLLSSRPSTDELQVLLRKLQDARVETMPSIAALEARLVDSQTELEKMRAELLQAQRFDPLEARRFANTDAFTEAEALLVRELQADRWGMQREDGQSRASLNLEFVAEEVDNLKQENSELRLQLIAANKERSHGDDTKREWDQMTIDRLRMEKSRAEEITATLAAQTMRMAEQRNEEVMRLKVKLTQVVEEKETDISVLRARVLSMERQMRWSSVSE